MTTALRWTRANLFSTPGNAVLTSSIVLLLVWAVPPVIDWAFLRAVWTGTSRDACVGADVGACWPYIWARAGQIIYGFYPDGERWRVDIVYALGIAGTLWLTLPNIPRKWLGAALMIFAFPVAAYVLLLGGVFGLEAVPTLHWGGLLLTLVVAVAGIAASLPLGILFALGRRSELPVIRWFSVTFIEVWRGVPMITVLFMAANMLPLFLPESLDTDKLFRALVAIAIFNAAYMAEVVRGGLQAIPRGQEEAAKALGLGYWRRMTFVVLPQALKISIPGLVNNMVSMLKDTSLISVIGFLDLLGVIQAGNTDPEWASPNTALTGYLFLAIIYWAACFSLSRYSARLERNLNVGARP